MIELLLGDPPLVGGPAAPILRVLDLDALLFQVEPEGDDTIVALTRPDRLRVCEPTFQTISISPVGFLSSVKVGMQSDHDKIRGGALPCKSQQITFIKV